MDLNKMYRESIKMTIWMALTKEWVCLILAINSNDDKAFQPIVDTAINPDVKIPC